MKKTAPEAETENVVEVKKERTDALKRLTKLSEAAVKAIAALHVATGKELDLIKEDGAEAHDLIPLYGFVRASKDAITEQTDKISGIHDHLKYGALPETFDRDDLRTLTTSSGDRVNITTDTLASILKDDREAAYKWLRAQNHGDLIIEMVHPGTLSAFAKTWMEEHGKDFPKAARIRVETRTKANFTKGKPKAKK